MYKVFFCGSFECFFLPSFLKKIIKVRKKNRPKQLYVLSHLNYLLSYIIYRCFEVCVFLSAYRTALLLQARHCLRCLLGSIRNAVALILCPQGTADMDVCKLLTWCCLPCTLIKDCAALLFHNLPSNMLGVPVSETPSLSVSHFMLTRVSP